MDVDRAPCLIRFYWGQGLFKWKDFRSLAIFLPQVLVSSAVTLGIQTLTDHWTKNSMRKMSLFKQPTSVLMQIIELSDLILSRNSKSCPIIDLIKRLMVRKIYLQKFIILLTKGILLSISFVVIYICFFMERNFLWISAQRLVVWILTGTVQCSAYISFFFLYWLLGSSEPNL